MQLENHDITRGDVLFFKAFTSAGNIKWKQGKVIDLNEHVKAVKLQFSPSTGRMKSEWMHVGELSLNDPTEKKDEQT